MFVLVKAPPHVEERREEKRRGDVGWGFIYVGTRYTRVVCAGAKGRLDGFGFKSF